jgi:hypothetical protein
MTIQEVKNTIESNTGLVGDFVTSSIDMVKGEYTRLNLEYMINLNPSDSVVNSFLAHGISGSYSMDKNYDYVIKDLQAQDMESDSKDYLDSLVGSTISSWDQLAMGDDNPGLCYTKVYITSASVEVPTPWLLTRSGSGVTHSSTTWDQFPINEA